MMFRFAFMLAFSLSGCLAYLDYDLEEIDKLWSRGAPAPGGTGSETAADCKRDILILWDNSYSVGLNGFSVAMIPFLKGLVNSKKLNVGPQGTHIGIITFSTQAETRVLLNMGQMKSKSQLLSYLDSLSYRDVAGDGTRTGMALKLADEIFWKDSPENYRPDVEDVVMIFTDGEPVKRSHESDFGFKKEKDLASYHAKRLKSRDVTVVGLAVGKEDRVAKFKDQIISWATSEKYYFQADAKSLNSIMDRLINASCVDPGQCRCDTTTSPGYAVAGQRTEVSWQKPVLYCQSEINPQVVATEVKPNIESPAMFDVGSHVITYSYTYRRGPKNVVRKCFANINVKACSCPSGIEIAAEVPPGKKEATVTWSVPKPNCALTLIKSYPESAATGQGDFPVGEHYVAYKYGDDKMMLTCTLKVNVEGVLCNGTAFNSQTEECCCGKIFEKKGDFACCGPIYYDTCYKKCERFYTLVTRKTPCSRGLDFL